MRDVISNVVNNVHKRMRVRFRFTILCHLLGLAYCIGECIIPMINKSSYIVSDKTLNPNLKSYAIYNMGIHGLKLFLLGFYEIS